MVDVGTVDIEQVKINRRDSCFVAPSDEGKRSDTTVVNDTLGECQSRGAESPQ